jgi:hypothetical protein
MDFDQINITLFTISDIFNALHKSSENFNITVEKPKMAKLEDVYLTFNNLFADWGFPIFHIFKLILDNYL